MDDHVVIKQNDQIIPRFLHSEIVATTEILILLVANHPNFREVIAKVFLRAVRAPVVHYHNLVLAPVETDGF